MSRVREIDTKSCTYCFFDDMTNIKNHAPNRFKINKKSYKNIFNYYIGYVTLNNVKPLSHLINKINGYIEKHNGNKYFI